MRIKLFTPVIVALLGLAGFVVYLTIQSSKPSQSTLGSSTSQTSASPNGPVCDQSLWRHVYHPQRLEIIEKCKRVSGIIESEKAEADGDYHIRLKLDDEYGSLVNSENIVKQSGDLVLEPICERTVTQADAVDSCRGFISKLIIPQTGSHVAVSGSYVLDSEHGWMEIHPISSIDVIP